jgi:hypothetical protein
MQAIADRVNPVITKLQSSANTVLDPQKRSDVNAVTSACVAGVEIAKPLAAINFKDEFSGSDRQVGINDVMFMFSHDAPTYCPEAHRDAACADWCISTYADLADAIERLRDHAAKENVQVAPLRK